MTPERRKEAVREFKEMTSRVSTITSIALMVCLGTTIALFVLSAIIPPVGTIDPSMFRAAGYMTGFATIFVLREAIREGLGVKLTHGDTTIEIKDQDGNSANIIEENETE